MSSVTAVPIPPTKRAYVVWLWIGVAAALVAALALAYHGTAGVVAERGTNEQFLAYNAGRAGVETTPSGLQYQVLEPGEGEQKPTDNDVAFVTYEGRLRDGSVFDSSERPVPMPVSRMIPGFSEGLKLMTKGAKFRFWIPANLAYGAQSPDPSRIPNDSVLVFDVTLHEIVPEQLFMQQMMQMQMGMGGGAPPR